MKITQRAFRMRRRALIRRPRGIGGGGIATTYALGCLKIRTRKLSTWPAAGSLRLIGGQGKLLYFFKRMGYLNIEGVDISPEQVKLARQVTASVAEADVLEWLEAHSSTFDLITALDLIEHFQKPEVLRFLDACYNALKPGGRLIIQTPNADSPWGTVHRYNDFTHEVGLNPNALSRLLALVGFARMESREIGPIAIGHSLRSTVRYAIWQTIRAGLKLWNMAETGGAGSSVFTRVFLIAAVKK